LSAEEEDAALEDSWVPGERTIALGKCPLSEAELDLAVTAAWGQCSSSGGSSRPTLHRVKSLPALWPYVRRTNGPAGLTVAGLDGARVFECREGDGEALAAADAEVGSQTTTCCLCEKSCPRAGSGFDSPALLNAHWELYKLLSDGNYDLERCGFCCAPAAQCSVTLAPFASACPQKGRQAAGGLEVLSASPRPCCGCAGSCGSCSRA
jgi:hypothetical protein